MENNKHIESVFDEQTESLIITFPTNRVVVRINLKTEAEELSEAKESFEKMKSGIAQLIESMSHNESITLHDVGEIEEIVFVNKTEWTNGSLSVVLPISSGHGTVAVLLPNSPDLLDQINSVAETLASI